jgi:1-acyl-sn-glycerol-3-phosphate acyltransferase
MEKALWLLYQPYKWLVFLPFFIVNTLFFGMLAIPLSLVAGHRIGSRVCGSWWSRVNTILTPAIVTVLGREHMAKGQSYVVAANHISAYDIFAVYGWLGIDLKWVMKKELRKVPGIGFGSEAVGHIFIDRSNTKNAIESIRKAREKIRGGISVIFFPEGTRSRKGNMLPFKKGAFKFALDMQLPVLPVTITGTDAVLPSDTLDLFPGRIQLLIHPPIDTYSFTEETVKVLMDKTYDAIAAGYGNPSHD